MSSAVMLSLSSGDEVSLRLSNTTASGKTYELFSAQLLLIKPEVVADPHYGTMQWNPEGTALSGSPQNTWNGITGFSEIIAVGVTTDTSDATADHFTIPTGGAGDYRVSYVVTGGVSSNYKRFEFAVFVNGAEQVETLSSNSTSNGGHHTSSGAAILTLSDADEVDLRGRNVNSTNSFNLWDTHLSIERISA